MPKIQEPLFESYSGKVDYGLTIDNHPWILEKNKNCILSPDSDGFLCGLLMTNYLESKIVGYYDGKILIIKDEVAPEDCIFIDHDINRQNICSIGHHIVSYNKNLTSVPNFNYDLCLQPNIIRNFDGEHDFQRKYPFGTIHLLLGILQEGGVIKTLPANAIWSLLFVDGVCNNLFGYPENCIDWIKYLRINKKNHILNPFFCSNKMNFYAIMKGLNSFFRMRDVYNAEGFYNGSNYILGGRNKRTGHQLKISNTGGNLINLIKLNSTYDVHDKEKARIAGFIEEMGSQIGWKYMPSHWTWENFRLYKFRKEIRSKTDSSKRLNNSTYIQLMNRNPLSLAMTASDRIEYTLEEPDRLS